MQALLFAKVIFEIYFDASVFLFMRWLCLSKENWFFLLFVHFFAFG